MRLLIALAILCMPMVVEAGEMVYVSDWNTKPAAQQKRVEMPYDDFLKMVSMKEHSDKTANKYAAENAVLVKLKDEQGTIIKVQQEQIANCEGIVRTHEQLGKTQEEISKAVQAELLGKTEELGKEKRLSRYKSEAFWLGLVAIGLWVVY